MQPRRAQATHKSLLLEIHVNETQGKWHNSKLLPNHLYLMSRNELIYTVDRYYLIVVEVDDNQIFWVFSALILHLKIGSRYIWTSFSTGAD